MTDGVEYLPNILNLDSDTDLIREIKHLNWCRPPSGIPGNRTPRNVAVLGDGSVINKLGELQKTAISEINEVSYPLFQTAKDSYAIYDKIPIPLHLRQFILKLRQIVRNTYGDSAKNIDSMFNVIVCNYYSESKHQISAHQDDERWLVKNLEKNGEHTSLIASLTYYPNTKNPSHLRKFQINDGNKWIDYKLENGSVILFSNHLHRVKPIPKKEPNIERINLTFRTLHPDLLGLIGYGNFYRYMSLPKRISICENKVSEEKIRLFWHAMIESNEFCKNSYFSNYEICSHNKDIIKKTKSNTRYSKYNTLPTHVKCLCSYFNIVNLYNIEFIKFNINII